jgi:hypothetical protein
MIRKLHIDIPALPPGFRNSSAGRWASRFKAVRTLSSRALNVRQQLYQAQINECAVKSALPFRGRRKVGFPAIIKQAGAGRKYGIKWESRSLQSDSSKKSDIEIRAPSSGRVLGRNIQSLYGIKCAKRTPRIPREL